jgi:hypothetical protein
LRSIGDADGRSQLLGDTLGKPLSNLIELVPEELAPLLQSAQIDRTVEPPLPRPKVSYEFLRQSEFGRRGHL